MSSTRPLALVTGASAGLGARFARHLAEDGFDLILVARRKEKLVELADSLQIAFDIEADVIPMDLAHPKAASNLVAEIQRPVDVLINNAGFGKYGSFAEMPPHQIEAMIQLNTVSLTLLTREVLPGMIERGRGRILNVASTAAFQPGPLMAVYYATKAYVLSFSEALAEELTGSGVTVTTLAPGPTETEFQGEAEMGRSRLFEGGLLRVMNAERVVEEAMEGLRKGKRLVVPGVMNKLTSIAPRFAPRALVPAIVKRMQKES